MNEPKNLYQKISEVMKDIQYLQKDDKVSVGQSGSYKAMSEEKVTQTVRESLIKNGLVILPIEQAHSRDEMRDKDGLLKGYLSIVDTKYKIVDIDSGQFEVLVSSGSGADTQDKGVGKAMTYSYKYMLLRTFAIPTGDDPDKVSSTTLDDQHEASKRNSTSSSQPPQGSYNRTNNQPSSNTNQQPQASGNQSGSPSTTTIKLATEGQVKLLRGKRRTAGFAGNEEINRFLGTSLTSLTELPMSKVNDLIKFLDEQKIPA